MRRVQRDRLALKNLRIVPMPSFVGINLRRLESIVKTIDRAALISMQPCAVASKRDQIGERNISVVPHERTRLIPQSHVGDQVRKIATRSLPLAVLTSLRHDPTLVRRGTPPSTAAGSDFIPSYNATPWPATTNLSISATRSSLA